jgi:predicted RND superfamily exporter protein
MPSPAADLVVLFRLLVRPLFGLLVKLLGVTQQLGLEAVVVDD